MSRFVRQKTREVFEVTLPLALRDMHPPQLDGANLVPGRRTHLSHRLPAHGPDAFLKVVGASVLARQPVNKLGDVRDLAAQDLIRSAGVELL